MGLKIKYNRCGKPNCRICSAGGKHGPYLYRQANKGKRRKHIYICSLRKHDLDTCPICGKQFAKKTNWHSYCSKSCKAKAYYQRRKLNPELHGREFQEEIKKQKEQNNEDKAKESPGPATPTGPAL